MNEECHLLGQASFFQLGDFSGLPEITVLLTKDVSDRLSSLKSSNPILFYAIIDAVSVLKDPILVPTLVVRDKWLRVAIRGSRGLGKIFGDRIIQTMEITEKLVDGLSHHYTFYDADEWTIDAKGSNEFEVSRLEVPD